ncbi:MAG: hypothetical protein PHF21_01740 [Bacilli bacterium]|nr:hypothetical protein [Bacilli bacterium]
MVTLYLTLSLNYNKYLTYSNFNTLEIQETKGCLDKIPRNSEIIAGTFFTPYLSDRKIVYMYPSRHVTKYVVLDLRYALEVDFLSLTNNNYKKLENCGYASIYIKNEDN